MKLGSDLNAQLNARGMNGNVRSDIPGVTVERDQFGGRYSSLIGNGGAPIDISGLNGNVRLTRAESASSDESKAPSSSKGNQ